MKQLRPGLSVRHCLLIRRLLADTPSRVLSEDERDARPHALGRIDRELAKHGVTVDGRRRMNPDRSFAHELAQRADHERRDARFVRRIAEELRREAERKRKAVRDQLTTGDRA